MLRTAMGSAIAAALADPHVTEIMVNPDGVLRLDRLGEGRVATDVVLDAATTERIVRLVASQAGGEVHADRPIISTELPPDADRGAGERFEGLLPPITDGPCFSIRKPAGRVHRLDDYVAGGLMSTIAADLLRAAVARRSNILIAGGTSSGKTTLANALLAELAAADSRIILIEDTRELQSPAPDTVALRTRPGSVSMRDLVRSTLRLRPDRIIVGEVRGPEALDMLKAWNTGHPGGIATVHANSAAAALTRIELLIQEAVASVPRILLVQAIDLIVFIAGRGVERRVASIARVIGVDPDTGAYALTELLPPNLKESDHDVSHSPSSLDRPGPAHACRPGAGGRHRHALGGPA
nr:P-type conjugative transfer ATPase TrbB [Sphingomonas sp. Y57]